MKKMKTKLIGSVTVSKGIPLKVAKDIIHDATWNGGLDVAELVISLATEEIGLDGASLIHVLNKAGDELDCYVLTEAGETFRLVEEESGASMTEEEMDQVLAGATS